LTVPPQLTSWAWLLPTVAAVAGSAATLYIKSVLNKRNISAKAGKTEAETGSIEAESLRESIQTLRERCNETDDQNTAMRKEIVETRRRVDECEEDRQNLHRLHEANARDLAAALKRIAAVESVLSLFRKRMERAGISTDLEAS
jgi:uncharacterized coiled-coil DUF342 family protein